MNHKEHRDHREIIGEKPIEQRIFFVLFVVFFRRGK